MCFSFKRLRVMGKVTGFKELKKNWLSDKPYFFPMKMPVFTGIFYAIIKQ